MELIITDHARFEAQRRHIDLEIVLSIIRGPQQKIPSRKGRAIFQSKYYDNIENKEMLLRAIVEQTGDVIKVVSIYKTSKIDKYWTKGEEDESYL